MQIVLIFFPFHEILENYIKHFGFIAISYMVSKHMEKAMFLILLVSVSKMIKTATFLFSVFEDLGVIRVELRPGIPKSLPDLQKQKN